MRLLVCTDRDCRRLWIERDGETVAGVDDDVWLFGVAVGGVDPEPPRATGVGPPNPVTPPQACRGRDQVTPSSQGELTLS
jgi:hypothetical protein